MVAALELNESSRGTRRDTAQNFGHFDAVGRSLAVKG
jgi:hypothetical protein